MNPRQNSSQGADRVQTGCRHRVQKTLAKLNHSVMGHGVIPDVNNVKFQRNYPSPSTHAARFLVVGSDGQTAGERARRETVH